MAKTHVSTIINGEPVEFLCEPQQTLLDVLSHERFGARYERGSGVVRFAAPQVLRDRLLVVPEGRSADPHVRFFLERNPGHSAGDELVSVASLEESNLTLAGRRMVGGFMARDREA